MGLHGGTVNITTIIVIRVIMFIYDSAATAVGTAVTGGFVVERILVDM
jgi:hypothetical protein